MAIQTAETPAAAQERIRLLQEQRAAEQAEQEASAPAFPISTIPDLRGDPTISRNRPPASAMDYKKTPENVLVQEEIAHVDSSPLGKAAEKRRIADEKKAEAAGRPMKEMGDRMDGKDLSTGKYSEKSAVDRIREMHMKSASEQPQGGLRSDGLTKTESPSGKAMLEKPSGPVDIQAPKTSQSRADAVRETKASMAPIDAERQAKPQFDEDGNQLPASTGVTNSSTNTTVGNFGNEDTASYRHYLNALESGVGKSYGQPVKDEEGNVTGYEPTEAGYKEFVKDMVGGNEQEFTKEKFIPETVRSEADTSNKGATKSGAVRGEKEDAAQELAKRRGQKSDDVTEGAVGWGGDEPEFNEEKLFEEETGREWSKATTAEKAKYRAMARAYTENAGELRDESNAYRAHQMGEDNRDQASANKNVRNMDRMTARGDEERVVAEARFKGKNGSKGANITDANDRGDHIIGGIGGGYQNNLNPNTGEYELQKTEARENLTHQRRIRNLLRTQMNNNPDQFLNRDGSFNEAAVQEWWEAHGGTDKVPSDYLNEGMTDDEGNPINNEGQNIAENPYGSLGMDTKSRFAHRMKDMAQRKDRVQDVALGASPAHAKYNADMQDMINNGEWEQAAALAGRNGDENTLNYLNNKMVSQNEILEAAAGNPGPDVRGGVGTDDKGTGNYATDAVIETIANGADPMSPQVQALWGEALSEDLKDFEAEMSAEGYQPGSPKYEAEKADAILKHPSFNRLMNTMFTQADPQPYEEGMIATAVNFFSSEPSTEGFTQNKQAMTEFVSQIMGSIGVAPGPHAQSLMKDIGKRYLDRMAARDENMGALRERWNAENPDREHEWRGEGFLTPFPEASEPAAEAAAAAAPPPPAAEPAAPPAPPQAAQAAPDAWHKQPTIDGEIIDKNRADEIMNSESNIRSMKQEEPKRKRLKSLLWNSAYENEDPKPLVPRSHPNPSLWE